MIETLKEFIETSFTILFCFLIVGFDKSVKYNLKDFIVVINKKVNDI
jgi:hypothetical protein